MEQLIEALQIFLKYGNPKYPTNCGYEVLAICGIKPDNVSDEDKKRLDELGFFVDEDEEEFISYKYGSA